jgi:hypothetical protein
MNFQKFWCWLKDNVERIRDNVADTYFGWRRLDEEKNPLNPFALGVTIAIALDVYDIIRSHHVTWLQLPSAAFVIPFLVLYFRKSRSAWIAVFVWFCLGAINTFGYYFLFYSRPRSARLVLVILAFYLLGVFYAFVIQRRYYNYLEAYHRCRGADRDIADRHNSTQLGV